VDAVQEQAMDLNVLTRGDVEHAVAVAPGDPRKYPQLLRQDDARGKADTQHVGIRFTLFVNTTRNAECAKFGGGGGAALEPLDLLLELVEVILQVGRQFVDGGHGSGSWIDLLN
jgi:hypothetical protein